MFNRFISSGISPTRLILHLTVAIAFMAISGCGDSNRPSKTENAPLEKTLKSSPSAFREQLIRALTSQGVQSHFPIPPLAVTEGPERNGFQTGVASLQLIGTVDKNSGKIVNLTILAPTSGPNNRAAANDLIAFTCLTLHTLEPAFDMDEAKDVIVGLSKSAMANAETVQTKYEHGLKISTLFNAQLHALMLFISPAQ